MDKKISIILSTYNEAFIIKTSIDKIFSTLDNVEIILVDDNSVDGTLEILKTIDNKNFKFYSRKSRGLASAFLLGLIMSIISISLLKLGSPKENMVLETIKVPDCSPLFA